MAEKANEFAGEIEAERRHLIATGRRRSDPRWLSFLGMSDVGKTHLAKEILAHVRKLPKPGLLVYSMEGEAPPPGWSAGLLDSVFEYWPKLAAELFDSPDRFEHAMKAHLLVLDDIAAETDRTGWATSKLCTLLDQRLNKWTVITSNKSMQWIHETMDARIASRLMRGRNVVLDDIQTKPYSMRKL